jgi:transcriptional regulator with XRE-family HTH domain
VGSEGVGGRIRQLRKLRGLTQHQLAAGTHFSVSLIKKVEAGSVPASPALIAEAARALTVKPAHLYGAESMDPVDALPVEAAAVAALRSALDAYDDAEPDERPWTLSHSRRRVADMGDLVYRLRYDEAAGALPAILRQLYPLTDATGSAGEQARAVLHDAYRLAASIAGQYRQADLAAICSERHTHLAPQTGDPIRIAISAYHRSHVPNHNPVIGSVRPRRHRLADQPCAMGIRLNMSRARPADSPNPSCIGRPCAREALARHPLCSRPTHRLQQ